MQKFDHLFIQPNDYSRSFLFYTEVLGWTVQQSFGEEADGSRLAYLGNGKDFMMVLAEDHKPAVPMKKPEVYQTRGRISVHFQVEDVDATYRKIQPGPHVITKPENNHWGSRWFVVEDPDGHQFGWQGPTKN